jgi:hypothetical protein
MPLHFAALREGALALPDLVELPADRLGGSGLDVLAVVLELAQDDVRR